MHKLARFVRKSVFFLIDKIANSFLDKEINFFIFLANSRIVQARFVLCGQFLSGIIRVIKHGIFRPFAEHSKVQARRDFALLKIFGSLSEILLTGVLLRVNVDLTY